MAQFLLLFFAEIAKPQLGHGHHLGLQTLAKELASNANAGEVCQGWFGPIAQRLEQATHNRLVLGSNPSGPTIPEQIDKTCLAGFEALTGAIPRRHICPEERLNGPAGVRAYG
jgi:hypothetical protein